MTEMIYHAVSKQYRDSSWTLDIDLPVRCKYTARPVLPTDTRRC